MKESDQNIETFGTTDLGLAVFLYWSGCKEADPPFDTVYGRKKMDLEFRFRDVDTDLIQSYRRDEHGFQRYNAIRRTFLQIVHTEIGDGNTP